MVICGVGINHQQIVENVQNYFVDEKPIWNNEKLDKIKIDYSIPKCTGRVIDCDIPTNPGLSVLSHVLIGLESMSIADTNYLATSYITNFMMGDGSSFSISGPDNGMYTKLNINVLKRYRWLTSAATYNVV